MITKDNLGEMPALLGFNKMSQKHSKTIGDSTLTADWKKGGFSYLDARGIL